MAAPARAPDVSAALAIFVKTPGLSPVKTRLALALGAATATAFHRRAATAVCDVVQAAVAAGLPLTPYYAVAEAAALDHAEWQGLPTLWQGSGDLGMRLHRVCSQLLARHGRVLLIGADAPQLDAGLLAQALAALDSAATPFVLGRACDGGFWLFGTRLPVPASVWRGVRYSRTTTADELVAALAAHGAVAGLPELTDVDEAADLGALADALDALHDARPAQRALRRWLHSISVAAETPRHRA